MQGCDAPTSSSWNAPLSTKTSAWFGLFLLLGLDFIFLLQAHYYAVEREREQSRLKNVRVSTQASAKSCRGKWPTQMTSLV